MKDSSHRHSEDTSTDKLTNWETNKFKLAITHFKEESKRMRTDLKNTKIFLNMVIHDLRNPTT